MTRPPSVGAPLNRVDGRLKVTGGARYAAEMPADRMVHGVMVQSTIANGRITRIDRAATERMPGVLLVLTHDNAPRLPVLDAKAGDQSIRALSLLQDDGVHYNGQPIAVVVAETLEQATDAAHALRAEYAMATATIDPAPLLDHSYPSPPPPPEQGGEPKPRGDVVAALDAAPVKIDATYITPLVNHNAMEPHAVTVVWSTEAGAEKLTVYDTTQGISQSKTTIAKRLGLPEERVHIVSHFVGGGFGSKGSTWSHVILAAMASRVVGRPVRLAVTRRQMFGPVGGRPMTIQRVTLGAAQDGTLQAFRHDSISTTAMMEDWTEHTNGPTRAVYAVPNYLGSERLIALNVGVPTYQRAPGESTGNFSMESAMDELAVALSMDPVALRLRNYAETEPDTGHPWSSKALRECYRIGAERFGWERRTAAPLSMAQGDMLVGWGMATASYPSHASKAACRGSVSLDASGNVLATFDAGTQDIGTGTYTVMTQVAADAVQLPVHQVRFELGDSLYPVNPNSGGSQTAASTSSGVHATGVLLREKLRALAHAGESDATLLRRLGEPVVVEGSWEPPESRKSHGTRAFGAVFVEVHVHRDTREVRVARVVAAYGANVLNAKTARSQLLGGIVWGIGMALTEATLLDPRSGRVVNADLAEYHVPVNADINQVDITIVPEPDSVVNPMGVKGIGEIGITGIPAAIANAVYHATGIRVRDLPITVDKVVASSG